MSDHNQRLLKLRARLMTPDPIYCPAQTYRQTRDNPAEYCENEVADYGDFCARHDEDDRADEAYERYREDARDDREAL